MILTIEFTDNPNNEYWIWERSIRPGADIHNFPHTFTNVAGGRSVAVYAAEGTDRRQIAQLVLPDYELLRQKVIAGEAVDLSFCYIDNFSWLDAEAAADASSYRQLAGFQASGSLWNAAGKENTVILRNLEIANGDMAFFYAGFCGVSMIFDNIILSDGNMVFVGARLHDSNIEMSYVECGGCRHHLPEITFQDVSGTGAQLAIRDIENRLSLNFTGTQLGRSEISVRGSVNGFEQISLDNAAAEKADFTDCEIRHFSAVGGCFGDLGFSKCIFADSSFIEAQAERFACYSSIIANIMKIDLFSVKSWGMGDTVISGKLYIDNFAEVLPAILRHTDSSAANVSGQLLTLKENFRQIGEYRNEDLCHLYYHRKATKNEPNRFKRVFNMFFDLICGYGTKPLRLLLLTIATIFVFALIFLIFNNIQFRGAETFIDYLYVSGVTFFTVGYGDVVPVNDLTKIFIIVEAFFGVSLMSWLLALLSRKIIR